MTPLPYEHRRYLSRGEQQTFDTALRRSSTLVHRADDELRHAATWPKYAQIAFWAAVGWAGIWLLPDMLERLG